MKHILILLSLIFVGIAISNLMRPLADLSFISVGLGVIGATYLIISILRRKVKVMG